MSRHSQCTDRTAERYINFSLMLVSNFFYSSDCKSLGGMLVGLAVQLEAGGGGAAGDT